MKKVRIAKKPFLCAYCGKRRTGAYRIVDDDKSCEACNRAYDYFQEPPEIRVQCPICRGEGFLRGGKVVPDDKDDQA